MRKIGSSGGTNAPLAARATACMPIAERCGDSAATRHIAEAGSGHNTRESESSAKTIQSGAIRIYDRSIFGFDLLPAQHGTKAFFGHRLREPGQRRPKFLVESSRE